MCPRRVSRRTARRHCSKVSCARTRPVRNVAHGTAVPRFLFPACSVPHALPRLFPDLSPVLYPARYCALYAVCFWAARVTRPLPARLCRAGVLSTRVFFYSAHFCQQARCCENSFRKRLTDATALSMNTAADQPAIPPGVTMPAFFTTPIAVRRATRDVFACGVARPAGCARVVEAFLLLR